VTRQELRAIILDELSNIAPDVDVERVDDGVHLSDEYDLDSMDALNLLKALHQRLSVDIPERDYARMRTLSELLDYIERALGRDA
jgi:acyl carrier protein